MINPYREEFMEKSYLKDEYKDIHLVASALPELKELVKRKDEILLKGIDFIQIDAQILWKYTDVHDVPKRTGFYLLTEGHPNSANNKAPLAGFYDTCIIRTLRQSSNDFVDVYLPYHQFSNGMVIASHTSGGYAVERIVADSVNLRTDTGQSTLYAMTQKAVTDALEGKVDKVQAKQIVTANKTLTAADNGKLLIINSDGITITMPANSNFTIDIAKMDESFTTVVQCAGTDKFREGTASISVIRDVSITNSGVSGKEWLAIGAYEV